MASTSGQSSSRGTGRTRSRPTTAPGASTTPRSTPRVWLPARSPRSFWSGATRPPARGRCSATGTLMRMAAIPSRSHGATSRATMGCIPSGLAPRGTCLRRCPEGVARTRRVTCPTCLAWTREGTTVHKRRVEASRASEGKDDCCSKTTPGLVWC